MFQIIDSEVSNFFCPVRNVVCQWIEYICKDVLYCSILRTYFQYWTICPLLRPSWTDHELVKWLIDLLRSTPSCPILSYPLIKQQSAHQLLQARQWSVLQITGAHVQHRVMCIRLYTRTSSRITIHEKGITRAVSGTLLGILGGGWESGPLSDQISGIHSRTKTEDLIMAL